MDLEFDANFYLQENPDVRDAGLSPLAHYLADGQREGRAPNASQKRRAYTMDIEDLATIDSIEKRDAIYDAEFLISIITPTFNTKPVMLKELKFTILNQIYENWEWVIVDDGSTSDVTHAALAELDNSDPRITVIFSEQNKGISAASNVALQSSRGTYIALVDHDDLLPRCALSSVYSYWKINPGVEIFYTDECKLMPDGTLGWFLGKPDWSPAYLENTMYLGHLVVYQSKFIRRLGGFRSDFDGTQDYDLALRAALCNPAVCHVPEFGYIWRAFEGSTALDVAEKGYSLERQRRAVAAYAAAKNANATILAGDAPGYWRLRYPEPRDRPRLTYVICDFVCNRRSKLTDDAAVDCIRALKRTEFYDHSQFLVLTDGQFDCEKTGIEGITAQPVEVVSSGHTDQAFYENLNQIGFRDDHDIFCIIDRSIRPITMNGGAEIVYYMLNNPKVALMSPAVLKHGKIWQNGTIKLRSGLGRAGADQDSSFGGPNNLLRCRRENFSGSEGIMFVSSREFRRLGGFKTSFPRIVCETEFSIRVRRQGFTCVIDPFVEVNRCDQEESVNPFLKMTDRAASELLSGVKDPYFSRWYDQARTDFQTRLNQFGV